MRVFDNTAWRLTALVGALAVAVALLHWGRPSHGGVIPITLAADQLASRRVDEQYRASAAASAPAYDAVTLAGSGAPGLRDGAGLWAQFKDPIDLSVSPDGRRLLVLDDGGRVLRQIDTETRTVTTLTGWHGADERAFLLKRAIATAGGMLLLGQADALFFGENGQTRLIAPAPDGPAVVSDLEFSNGRLVVLDGPAGRIFSAEPGTWRWRALAELPPGAFDRVTVDDGANRFVAASSVTGRWIRKEFGSGAVQGEFVAPKGVLQVMTDPSGNRYFALYADGLRGTSRDRFTAPELLSMWSIEGRRVGVPTAPSGYRTTWMSGAVRLAFDARRSSLYSVNRSDRRVTAMVDSFASWKYDEPPHNMMSADYPPFKAAGSTRLLWLSNSVFWDPAGLEEGNLALGAPRQLEVLLNASAPQAGRWEVLNPGLTGTGFYENVFPSTKRILQTYGLDYAVMVVDIQTVYWTLLFSGYTVPSAFDPAGMPAGVDAELAKQPPSERSYREPMRPLVEYMRTSMKGPSASIPMLAADGTIVPSQFMRAWTEDAKFRALVGDVFVKLAAGIRKACDEHGVKFAVLVAPTSNLVAGNEWFDTTKLGVDRPYDFEAVHRPLLERLWASAVPAYDLTYDVLARHPRLFPFNADSHHRSGLFHRAIAESIEAVARRFSVFSFAPQPARSPSGGAVAGPAPANVVVTERGGTCFVLHDIWDVRTRSARARSFDQLLALGVDDAARSVAGRSTSCSEYRVSFVYIKNRDDYGNRDFRGIEQVASMRLPVANLGTLGDAARGRVDNAELHSAVQFERR